MFVRRSSRRPSLLESLEGRRLLATVNWDGGGSDSNWNTPENWVGDQVPNANDDAVIAGSGGGTPNLTGTIAIHSVTISRYTTIWGALVNLSGELRVTSGTTVQASYGKIDGAGKIVIEAGAKWSGDGFTQAMTADLYVPVDNYGRATLAGSYSFGPAFHNYGEATALESGMCYGVFYNEPTGVLRTGYVPSSASGVSFGRQRTSDGVVSPALFVNKGLVRAGDLGGSDAGDGLTYDGVNEVLLNQAHFLLDATPTLGGQWHGTMPITFTSGDSPVATTTTLDASFQWLQGTMRVDGTHLDATAGTFADDTGFRITGTAAKRGTVTLHQSHTKLALLKLYGNGSVNVAPGSNRVLRVEDIEFKNADNRIDVGDNLFIHGNQPGYLRSWVTPTAPAALPAYHAVIRGSAYGQVLTVNLGTDPSESYKYGVAFATGNAFVPTFRGETVDDNDFIFFPTLRGDANLDRQVNFDDLLVLAKRYNTTAIRGVADGNFDRPATTGPIDFDDLLLVSQNYGSTYVVTVRPAEAVKAKTAAASRRMTDDVLR